MTDEQSGSRTDRPTLTVQDQQTQSAEPSAPDVEEAVDESGASAGGGALTALASQSGLHDVKGEQADHRATATAVDPDGDGELVARLIDTDGDGTADDALINAPAAP